MNERLDILFRQEELLHKNIRFADQKAAVLITLNLALLGTLLKHYSPPPELSWQIVFLLACLGFAVILVGGFIVIMPRSRFYPLAKTLTALPKDDDHYVETLNKHIEAQDKSQTTEFEQDLQKLVLQRGKINRDKYRWLGRLVWTCFIVWGLALLSLVCYLAHRFKFESL